MLLIVRHLEIKATLDVNIATKRRLVSHRHQTSKWFLIWASSSCDWFSHLIVSMYRCMWAFCSCSSERWIAFDLLLPFRSICELVEVGSLPITDNLLVSLRRTSASARAIIASAEIKSSGPIAIESVFNRFCVFKSERPGSSLRCVRYTSIVELMAWSKASAWIEFVCWTMFWNCYRLYQKVLASQKQKKKKPTWEEGIAGV